VESKVRVALIGCGRVARVHAQALKRLQETELKAVVDIVEEKAKFFSETYDVKDWYTDYHKVIERDDIDAVEICLPHYLHAEVAINAMKSGKHVLTEKPMAITLEDADKMIATSEECRVTLGVIFQNRYNDASVAVKKAITSGRLGTIKGTRMMLTWYRPDSYYRESDWKGTWDKEGGGVLIDQAIHTLDLMQWLIGTGIDYIRATYDTRAHSYINVDDVAEAYIKFKPDIVGCVYANCFYPYDAPVFLEIFGTDGMAHIIGDKATIYLGNETVQVEQASNPGSGLRYWGSSHERQIKDFYQDLLLGRKPFIDGREGRTALAMVLSMYESSRTGKPVKFPY